jgi:acyl-homoserine-lactone acylase
MISICCLRLAACSLKLVACSCLLLSIRSAAQVNPDSITIVRDSFGVPHIFANTDAGGAYGLAWCQAEDDFESVQLFMLAGKARLGSSIGRKGAEADYVVKLLRCRELVEEQWGTLSPDFLQLIKGYVAGLNAYRKAFPQQIKYKKAFPFDEKDYMTSVIFSLSIFCGADNALSQVLGGRVSTIPGFTPQGSNAIAIHSSRTNTGEAFLAINAHQPLEGPTAFYEAHIKTKEGWNMLGGSVPGGCLIFHGTNEHLGWANTINYMDKVDVYQLEMNPSNSNQYKFDGQWIELETKNARLNVKGVPVTIKKKIYWSKYGATVKTSKGVFALRIIGNMDIKALEEWYRMNKAKNFTEFYQALSMTSLPMFNIMYADRNDTIFYISNGKIPRRNPDPKYNWQGTLPGNTSATLWTTFKRLQELPQYLNPRSGYLFNTNHSPFLATDSSGNLDSKKYDPADGFETFHNNRSQRITELIKDIGKVDYPGFKRIKFDWHLPKELKFPYGIDTLLTLTAAEYPQLTDVITTFQQWDRAGNTDSKGAAIFLLIYNYVVDSMRGQSPRNLTKADAVHIFQYVDSYLRKHFGRTGISLGEIQKMVRGNEERPAFGLPDVLAAAYTAPYKNGMRRVVSGDAYICFVRYPKVGLPIIESVNTFGASANPASPHYKDQMPLFGKQETKRMTLDEDEILRTAERIYHPKR